MIAMSKEHSMDQQFRNRRRFPIDLCGPYAGDECEGNEVCCDLEIARSHVAVDIPAALLRKYRLQGGDSEIVLRIPGEQRFRVNATPLLTDKQQKSAAGWSAEMHDFDRF
jgi:hypothetical protein